MKRLRYYMSPVIFMFVLLLLVIPLAVLNVFVDINLFEKTFNPIGYIFIFITTIFTVSIISSEKLTYVLRENLFTGWSFKVLIWGLIGLVMAGGLTTTKVLFGEYLFTYFGFRPIMILYFPYVLFFVFIGAFVEELIFRRVLFNFFRSEFGLVISIVITATLFSMVHTDIYRFLFAERYMVFFSVFFRRMFYGVLMSILYIKFKENLLVPTLVHTGSNFLYAQVLDHGEKGQLFFIDGFAGHVGTVFSYKDYFYLISPIYFLVLIVIALVILRKKEAN